MSHTMADPVLRSARREAVLTVLVWAVVTTYSIAYCYLHGYNRPIEDLTFVLGFPDWVFWGIIAPWAACYVIGLVFCFAIIQDDPLGRDVGDDDAPGAGGDA